MSTEHSTAASASQASISLIIKNVRCLDPEHAQDSIHDVFIHNGRLSFSRDLSVQYQFLDGKGLWLCPGFCDLSHHYHRNTSASELQAAASNGFISIVCPPTTQPVNDTAAITNWMLEYVNGNSPINSLDAKATALAKQIELLPLGALSAGLKGEQLSDMFALKAAGCVGLSNAGFAIKNTLIRLRCFEYAACADMIIFSRPEDMALSDDGCAHDGFIAEKLGLKAIPSCSESIAVARDLLLAEQTGVRLHFSRLSSYKSLQLIDIARQNGQAVTCDVGAANLLFTDAAIEDFDSVYHVHPPLRSEKDRVALLAGLESGLIQAICSNHQALDSTAKMAPFAQSTPGMATLDGLLPMLLKLVETQQLSLTTLLKALSSGPTSCLSRPTASLKTASLVLIDPAHEWQLNSSNQHSYASNLPFTEQPLKGKALLTLREGRVLYQDAALKFS